ncbi:MAG: hypothetical protein AB8I08_27890 [Sandaracinaceae bacterium]
MSSRAIVWALLGVVAAWGCDEAPPPDPCAERLTVLEQRLTARRSMRDPSGVPPDVALPSIDGTMPAPELPLLVVSEDEVLFEGRGAGGLATFEATTGALLQDLRLQMDLRGGDEPIEVGLWVEPTVTLETLQRLLGHAHPRLRFVLLARGPVAPVGTMPAWLETELSRIDPPVEGEGEGFPAVSVVTPEMQRRARLPAAWIRATASCEGATGALRFDERGTLLRASVGPLVNAVRGCGCDTADVAAIESVALESFRSGEGPLVRVPAPLRFGSGNGVELDLAASTTVESLARRVSERPAELTYVRAE